MRVTVELPEDFEEQFEDFRVKNNFTKQQAMAHLLKIVMDRHLMSSPIWRTRRKEKDAT
jgi:hypothetical protein